jgi:hypothetical protein
MKVNKCGTFSTGKIIPDAMTAEQSAVQIHFIAVPQPMD